MGVAYPPWNQAHPPNLSSGNNNDPCGVLVLQAGSSLWASLSRFQEPARPQEPPLALSFG